MTRYRIPKFCETYKVDIEIYDPKSKGILPRKIKQRDLFVHIHKNHYCVIWKKNRKDSSLNGIQEIDKNFKYVKNTINENSLEQRILYRFPKHETIAQLENVFVFDLETHNDHEFAEAYAGRLYDVYRLPDRWNRDLTPNEIMIEKEILTFFMLLMETPSSACLNIFQIIMMEMKGRILIKTEMR